MQLKKGIGERSAIRATVDYEMIFQPRKVSKVSESAPVFLIEKRSNLLTQTCHEISFGFATSYRTGWKVSSYLTASRRRLRLLHKERSCVTMKYLATSSDG